MTVTSVRPPISETDTTAAPDAMPEEAGQPEGKAPRGQSTIGFPYADLNDALVIAKTIRDRGGAPVAKDQLAAAMGQAATSGAFSAKLHAARMFGLVRFIAGKIKISDLAYEAIDTDEVRSKAAKVTAFLTVPLFARTYDEFRNRQLPPRPQGLEQAFVSFGVLEKRKTNARWAFDRSARQAGFFENGDDRLVAPIVTGGQSSFPGERTEAATPTSASMETPGANTLPVAAQQLLIKGLLERLPGPDTSWSLNDRVRWLRALAVNLAMIYGDKDESDISIQAPTKPVVPVPRTASVQSAPSAQTSVPPKPNTGRGDLDDEIPF